MLYILGTCTRGLSWVAKLHVFCKVGVFLSYERGRGDGDDHRVGALAVARDTLVVGDTGRANGLDAGGCSERREDVEHEEENSTTRVHHVTATSFNEMEGFLRVKCAGARGDVARAGLLELRGKTRGEDKTASRASVSQAIQLKNDATILLH